MSNALVTLFVVALMLVAVLTWSSVTFDSMDSGVESWKAMVEAAEETSRTDIEVTGAEKKALFVEVLVENTGKVNLAQFDNWDVLVEYYDGNDTYRVGSLTYTEAASPSDNQWTVSTIYADDTLAQGEVFEPGILSPGEVMLIKLKLTPQLGAATTNRVTVSSPNGVVASAQFSG